MGINEAAAGYNLLGQWTNPSDVTPILMVIGGDVVQKALAAGTGTWWFTPVCFSFGWVSYSFIALMSIIGNGCLMPSPDCPVKVINLDSGYTRQNMNWALGRFVRDFESGIVGDGHSGIAAPRHDEEGRPTLRHIAIRIKVYSAKVESNWRHSFDLPVTRMYIIGLFSTLLQLGLASIPICLLGEWDIMMMTGIGTMLSQMAGWLPQWKAEKTPFRKKQKSIALTGGNGCQDVIVIIGDQNCWDLEAFAAPRQPRIARGWESNDNCRAHLQNMHWGFPIGFWITIVGVLGQCVLWLAFLVNVTSKRGLNWVLVAIGLVGVFQNTYTAGMRRDERQLSLKLDHIETIEAGKVMDGIMDLEVKHGLGRHLVPEYFPGELRKIEVYWWKGQREEYDDIRRKKHSEDKTSRTPPAKRATNKGGE